MDIKRSIKKALHNKPKKTEVQKAAPKHPYEDFIKLLSEREDKVYMHRIYSQSIDWYDSIRKAMETISATPIDLFVHGLTYRAEAINKGYVTLTKGGNYICAIALIRMQLDNAVMAMAGLLANNQDIFFLTYNSGKPINRLSDPNGNSLTQGFIVRQLAESDPRIKEIFYDGSEYIHASRVTQDASINLTSGLQLMNYENYTTPEPIRKKAHADMILANNILIDVLVKWVKLKHT